MKGLPELRKDAMVIYKTALAAADPADAVRRHVVLRDGVLQIEGRGYRLSDFDGVYVIGAGKASARMAQESYT